MNRCLRTSSFTVLGWDVLIAWNAVRYTYRYLRHRRDIRHPYCWPWPVRAFDFSCDCYADVVYLGPIRLTRLETELAYHG